MSSSCLAKISTVRGIFQKHSFTFACQLCFSLNKPISKGQIRYQSTKSRTEPEIGTGKGLEIGYVLQGIVTTHKTLPEESADVEGNWTKKIANIGIISCILPSVDLQVFLVLLFHKGSRNKLIVFQKLPHFSCKVETPGNSQWGHSEVCLWFYGLRSERELETFSPDYFFNFSTNLSGVSDLF